MLTKNFLIQFQWTISLLLQLFLFGCFCCSCKIHCNFTFAWKIIGLAIAIPLFLLSTSLFRDLFKNLCLWLWRSCRFIRYKLRLALIFRYYYNSLYDSPQPEELYWPISPFSPCRVGFLRLISTCMTPSLERRVNLKIS